MPSSSLNIALHKQQAKRIVSDEFNLVLPPKSVLIEKVTEWIHEDIPSFDVGAAVVGDDIVEATLYYKPGAMDEYCVLAGQPFVNVILKDCFGAERIEWFFKEGDIVAPGAGQQAELPSNGTDGSHIDAQSIQKKLRVPVARVRGPANALLQAERISLNLLARCSATATISHQFRQLKEQHDFHGEIAATRKTTPGFRMVEKYGVIVGGCSPHRNDVSQMVMLKDNHIDAFHGDIAAMVSHAKRLGGFSVMIEVECRSIEDAHTASQAGAHIVMLDNFSPEALKQAAAELKKAHPNVLIEASGGMTLDNIAAYFDPNIDVISTSQLLYGGGRHGGGKVVDFSLKVSNPAGWGTVTKKLSTSTPQQAVVATKYLLCRSMQWDDSC